MPLSFCLPTSCVFLERSCHSSFGLDNFERFAFPQVISASLSEASFAPFGFQLKTWCGFVWFCAFPTFEPLCQLSLLLGCFSQCFMFLCFTFMQFHTQTSGNYLRGCSCQTIIFNYIYSNSVIMFLKYTHTLVGGGLLLNTILKELFKEPI